MTFKRFVLWDRFHGLSTALMESLDRWQTGFAELARIDVNPIFPDLAAFCSGIDARFDQIRRALGGNPSGHGARAGSLSVDTGALHRLPHFDRAALAVAGKELENLDALTVSLLECARDLAGEPAGDRTSDPIPPHEGRVRVFHPAGARPGLPAAGGLCRNNGGRRISRLDLRQPAGPRRLVLAFLLIGHGRRRHAAGEGDTC